MSIKYISVCSGIEAASIAWHDMGWEPVAFSEIELFPSEVLKTRFPNTPNWGDMTKFNNWPDATINLLVGGTPCQSFSVAGLRQGLKDPRGNLMLTFLGIAERYKPKWIVWENVPGVLSSNGGKDFGSFLGALGQLGYGWAYRVLDAQWFGVAQRRKRVFVVGCLGDQRAAAEVLFESESVSRNPAPSREKRQATAGSTEEGVGSGKWWDGGDTSATITTRSGGQYMPDKDNFQAVIQPTVGALCARDYKGVGNQYVSEGKLITENNAVAHAFKIRGGCEGGGKGYLGQDEQVFTISTHQDQHIAHPIAVDTFNQTTNEHTSQTLGSSATDVNHYGAVINPPMAIRRLTPVECERLQGFPDNWTQIPWKNKPAEECPDGPRYKACGNSMAVPVMRWIGQRINKKTDHL